MIDTHSVRVVDPVEADAQRLADAFAFADPVFTELVLRSLRLYALVMPRSLSDIDRGTWAVACLADALNPAAE